MFTKTLLPDTLRATKLASRIPIVKRAYLAGGTALALQIGHRTSIDLDFFTQEKFDENLVATDLSRFPEFKEDTRAWATVLGWIGKTRFSIFYYEPKLIDKLIPFEGIQLASKKDIAAMKLHAISDRGLKRDFIDLFFLANEFTLSKMFDFYINKYGEDDNKIYSIIKGLEYFSDATDDMPKMLVPVDWEKVKEFFKEEVKKLSKEFLSLDHDLYLKEQEDMKVLPSVRKAIKKTRKR